MVSTRQGTVTKKTKQSQTYKKWYSSPTNREKKKKSTKLAQLQVKQTVKELELKVDNLSTQMKDAEDNYASTVSILKALSFDVGNFIIDKGKCHKNDDSFPSKQSFEKTSACSFNQGDSC